MARPAKTRRLADIDPVAFAVAVSQCATDHVAGLICIPERKVNWTVSVLEDLLVYEATALAHYAKAGVRPETDDIEDILWVVCQTLFSHAMVEHSIVTPDDIDVDSASDLGIVLLATQARLRIARNERVPVRELACLAGLDPDHVRLLARDGQMAQGQMALIAGGVTAKVTKQWLEARGVALPS